MRLLLVEDNEALASNLAEVFRDQGHDVTMAGNGAKGLAMAAQGFDLALVDVRLPDGPGTALITRLKNLTPDAEVIVTSGNADLESAIAAVQNGAFSYLLKPVAIPDLLLTVARALERVQLRRQARALQEELTQSERRYRDIVETAQVLLFALDKDHHIQFANTTAEEVTGYRRDDLSGKNYVDLLVPASDHAITRATLDAAFHGPTPERVVEILGADGGRRSIRMRWAHRTERGEAVLYGIALDVTRQVQLERERRTSEKLAVVGTLTAGLAHEIRNPLNAALLQLTLLERRLGKLPEADRPTLLQPLDLVRTELSRLTRLLGDFLAFARPREFGRRPINFSALVEQLVTMQQAVATQTRRRLTAKTQPGLTVAADEDALKAAVVNLLKNALEVASKSVKVTLEDDEGVAVLRIEDDGPGISEDAAAHLFEPFFTTKEGGTGLGLPMVYAVVSGHGGEVSLRSRPEGGAVARLALPLYGPG